MHSCPSHALDRLIIRSCVCVCVCVCVCAKGINSVMLKLRGSTFLLSYHYCKPSVLCMCVRVCVCVCVCA